MAVNVLTVGNSLTKYVSTDFSKEQCIKELPKSFIYWQMHFLSVLENIKIYINIYIKTAPTCFGLRPSSGSLHMGLAKVTFIKSVKLCRYVAHNRNM